MGCGASSKESHFRDYLSVCSSTCTQTRRLSSITLQIDHSVTQLWKCDMKRVDGQKLKIKKKGQKRCRNVKDKKDHFGLNWYSIYYDHTWFQGNAAEDNVIQKFILDLRKGFKGKVKGLHPEPRKKRCGWHYGRGAGILKGGMGSKKMMNERL